MEDFNCESRVDRFRQLGAYASMAYRESAFLIPDPAGVRVSQYTSSSARFLKEIDQMPHGDDDLSIVFYRLLSGSSSDSAGWFALLLSCKLIIASISSNLPISIVSRGLSRALRDASNELSVEEGRTLSECSCLAFKLSWGDLDSILCVIRSSLSARHILQLTQSQIDKIRIPILTAFLSSVDESNRKCSIIYRQSVGLPVENMIVLEDSLVMDIPVPFGLQLARRQKSNDGFSGGMYRNLVVVIFENSLEMSEFPNFSFEVTVNRSVRNNDGDQVEDDSVKSSEYRFLERMAAALKRSGVGLVACQRRIHPHLIRILHRHGIISLPRLSIRFCGALQRLCGARQLVSFPLSRDMDNVVDPGSLGYLSSLDYRVIYGRKYVVACARSDSSNSDNGDTLLSDLFGVDCALEISSRRSRMSTVVLTAPSEALCAELEAAMEGVSTTLTSLLTCPYVLPGAGLWQAYLAKRLRQMVPAKSSSHPARGKDLFSIGGAGEMEKARGIFISCLEDCGRIIGGHSTGSFEHEETPFVVPCDDPGGDSDAAFFNPVKNSTVRSRLIDSTMTGEVSGDSSDVGSGRRSRCVVTADALEALAPNINALQLAVDAAICILDIDDFLLSYPEEIKKEYD